MASSTSIFFTLFLSALILLNSPSLSLADDLDLDEDVAFLASEEAKERRHVPYGDDLDQFQYQGFENYEDLESGEGGHEHGHEYGGAYEEEPPLFPTVDEKDVVVLTKENFTEFVGNNSFVIVEFYAPWCGHCQALAPEYAAAATEVKGVAVLAKVDATEAVEVAQKYEVQGFPTVFLFVDGQVQKTYEGERTKDAIVAWVKKKTSPSIQNITTTEEAERVLSSEPKVVLGFLNSLVGSESEELAAASKLDEDVSFYQTTSPDVAKLFKIESGDKRPALVILKKEDEIFTSFDGNFSKAAIAEFVLANKAPLVINFTRESASLIFENPIKNQLILFAAANETEKHLSAFREVAKALKGKFVFVYVQMDNKDYGEAVSDFFGVTGTAPRVMVYTGNEDTRKFLLDGELTLENIKTFGEDFLADKLKPFYKSDPVPEKNDGDVKIVVGNNFDEIVLDESKDVLLEIYAPWCGHCQALEPTYNKLGKYLKGIDTLVIAKMDGTTNEHPRAKADGYPTLLFFPAGNKSFEPITVETDRTVVEIYKFLKKHASTPFKLQKPVSPVKPPASGPVISNEEPKVTDYTKEDGKTAESDGKDEL